MTELYSKDKSIKLRKSLIGDACTLFFPNDPLKIVRASGQYMYDEDGKEYLDCINNVCHVGHSHPKVAEAGSKQMSILNTNARFLHDNILCLAERLSATLPPELCVFYFCNSGSEATDLALRLARLHTKQYDTITLDYAYHGHVLSALQISSYKGTEELNRCGYVHIAPPADSYRGRYRDTNYTEDELSKKYADDVHDIIESIQAFDRNVACYIAESLQSCGGQIVYPKNHLKQVYKHVRDAGGVCIADEVQTGFGRTGSHFWAFQTQDVVPDIVTMGKPMGNGHPISAVVTTREIAASHTKSNCGYFATFGGNPVSCAIGLAVLDVIRDDKLMENATLIGKYLLEKFSALKDKHKLIGDVRGLGLFIGLDLVTNRKTREPATQEAKYIVQRLKEEHILLNRDGPHENVLKFKPPMCFTIENADHLTATLDKVFSELSDDAALKMKVAEKRAREKQLNLEFEETIKSRITTLGGGIVCGGSLSESFEENPRKKMRV